MIKVNPCHIVICEYICHLTLRFRVNSFSIIKINVILNKHITITKHFYLPVGQYTIGYFIH